MGDRTRQRKNVRPTLSLAIGTNRQFYCTGVIINIIYNKLDNYFFVSVDRQTFFGFEMTADLRDFSPLSISGKMNGYILNAALSY